MYVGARSPARSSLTSSTHGPGREWCAESGGDAYTRHDSALPGGDVRRIRSGRAVNCPRRKLVTRWGIWTATLRAHWRSVTTGMRGASTRESAFGAPCPCSTLDCRKRLLGNSGGRQSDSPAARSHCLRPPRSGSGRAVLARPRCPGRAALSWSGRAVLVRPKRREAGARHHATGSCTATSIRPMWPCFIFRLSIGHRLGSAPTPTPASTNNQPPAHRPWARPWRQAGIDYLWRPIGTVDVAIAYICEVVPEPPAQTISRPG